MAACTSTYMSRQVFPQAPSPTITSFRRISAMANCVGCVFGVVEGGQGSCCENRMSAEDEKEW
jgi:hypothetical protein